LMFSLGRWRGEKMMQLPGFRRVLTPARFEKAQAAFEKYGRWVMFVARFLPGLRTPVFFTAGMTGKVKFSTWFLMDGFAALISVPVWIYLGYFGAQNREWLFATLHKFQYGLFFLLGVGAIALFVWWRKKKRAERSGS
ncbi:MAG: DedA family protein, partial [Brachymonas sp.]|nr:DedA family protein [Brachymonas sp.]